MDDKNVLKLDVTGKYLSLNDDQPNMHKKTGKINANNKRKESIDMKKQYCTRIRITLRSLLWALNLGASIVALVAFFNILSQSNRHAFLKSNIYYWSRIIWMLTLIILPTWTYYCQNHKKPITKYTNLNHSIFVILLPFALSYPIFMSLLTFYHEETQREGYYYIGMAIVLYLPGMLLKSNINLDEWHSINKSICQTVVAINFLILLIIEVAWPCLDLNEFRDMFETLLGSSEKGYFLIFFTRLLMIMFVYHCVWLFLFSSNFNYRHHINHKFVLITLGIISIGLEFSTDTPTNPKIKDAVSWIWAVVYVLMILYCLFMLLFICWIESNANNVPGVSLQLLQQQSQQDVHDNNHIIFKDSIEGSLSLVGNIFVGLTYLASQDWKVDSGLVRAISGSLVDFFSWFILYIITGINCHRFRGYKAFTSFLWCNTALHLCMMLRLFVFEYDDIMCIIKNADNKCPEFQQGHNQWWNIHFGFFFMATEYQYWLFEHYMDILSLCTYGDQDANTHDNENGDENVKGNRGANGGNRDDIC